MLTTTGYWGKVNQKHKEKGLYVQQDSLNQRLMMASLTRICSSGTFQSKGTQMYCYSERKIVVFLKGNLLCNPLDLFIQEKN